MEAVGHSGVEAADDVGMAELADELGLAPQARGALVVRVLRGSPAEAAWALIEAANQAGGQDNVSVVIVVVEP